MTAKGYVTSPESLLYCFCVCFQTPSSLTHSSFLFSKGKSCLLRCWQKCLHFYSRKLPCVYLKRLLKFDEGEAQATCLFCFQTQDFRLKSIRLRKKKAECFGSFKLELPLLYLWYRPACLFLLSPPLSAAFTLITIEVIRTNITSLERCHRGADFKCVWVIVPI